MNNNSARVLNEDDERSKVEVDQKMIDPMCKTTVFFKLRDKKEINHHETVSTLKKERIDDTLEEYVITEQLQH